MTKKCRAGPGMHSVAPHLCLHSAVLSLPAVLLHKVPNDTMVRRHVNLIVIAGKIDSLIDT